MNENIYQMYVANGNRAGFYVRRANWTGTYARVVSVAGRESGPLRGRPPYFGNPPVTMDVYNLDGTVRARGQELLSPGNRSYSLFVPPNASEGP
jgi:hypothetical protein